MDDAEARRRIAVTMRLWDMTPDEIHADYVARVVGRDAIAGLVVSTAWTEDHGFETAILDLAGAHPVERYPDRVVAGTGHTKWRRIAETAEEIVRLGLPEVGLESWTHRLQRGYGQ
jgi:hypothetical protein